MNAICLNGPFDAPRSLPESEIARRLRGLECLELCFSIRAKSPSGPPILRAWRDLRVAPQRLAVECPFKFPPICSCRYCRLGRLHLFFDKWESPVSLAGKKVTQHSDWT